MKNNWCRSLVRRDNAPKLVNCPFRVAGSLCRQSSGRICLRPLKSQLCAPPWRRKTIGLEFRREVLTNAQQVTYSLLLLHFSRTHRGKVALELLFFHEKFILPIIRRGSQIPIFFPWNFTSFITSYIYWSARARVPPAWSIHMLRHNAPSVCVFVPDALRRNKNASSGSSNNNFSVIPNLSRRPCPHYMGPDSLFRPQQ